MRRPEFTPRVWFNEDNTLMFRMDRYGMTDICSGPNSKLMAYLRGELTDTERDLLFPRRRRYTPNAPQHVHWAYDPKIED